jgi:hypothetical protein
MADVPATAISNFLSTLRTLPVWLLGGLALVGYAVLFAPGFAGIDPSGFRTQWGVWIWIEAIGFSILTITRAIDSSVSAYLESRRRRAEQRVLRLVPRHLQCWWHLAKQRDDSFVSQISFDVEAANLTDHPVRIVKARLIRPRGDLLHCEVTLPEAGSPYHSARHAVPPHDTVTTSLHIMVRGAIARQGHPLRATIGITDQFGEEYRLKGIVIPTHDAPLPKQPFAARITAALKALPGFRSAIESSPETLQTQPTEWQHRGRFEQADFVLNEEKRSYAACGRARGGLGSLNVGLQSEPNLGATSVRSVPTLLWEKTKPIESPNLARLLTIHSVLGEADQAGLESYLLSLLRKGSPYADVSYLIFLALHRMGRSIDALRAARLYLAGDRDYAYSNLLGTLSAIVSREHFLILAHLSVRSTP